MIIVSGATTQCVNKFCTNCTDQNFCTSCVDSRWGDTCQFECECHGKCNLFNGFCLSCPEGYYSGRQCIKCEDNCKTCSSSLSCYQCFQGFTYLNGKCYNNLTLPDTCATPRQPETLRCDVCKDGWWGSRCEYQCGFCLHGKCTKSGNCPCLKGYYSSTCTSKCSVGCSDGEC